MGELLTIGYEGSNIADFVATLKRSDVKILIDVRELPLSRKKGFSKRALKGALEAADIQYTHFKDLGDPKPGRDAARAGDFATFRKIFSQHMRSPAAQAAIEEAIPLVKNGGACLLCFERCHSNCHRSIVASELLERTSLLIRHIGVQPGLAGAFAN
ncbi:DUF488 family protein [Hoeflea poritis]|uniref:DUF488 domain-containing protein n=1 Tax=Hoeflea poritis TaxID=2993659 RepID=A0ABT4VVN7_9HYPH|nr:DUF488 domain-containing protein [Hoeflea poritis]MDA4848048.1 DUF488 domain-containing protein [Hoeflea poritis]